MRRDCRNWKSELRLCGVTDPARLEWLKLVERKCFTDGVKDDMSGVDPSTNEGSGGPAPGIVCPGAGSGIATPSIPTL